MAALGTLKNGSVFCPPLLGVRAGAVRVRMATGQARVLVTTEALSADHRVSDGHRGGLFLAAVERLLREPDRL